MLKFANVARVGEVIRAYDFKPMLGRSDCYLEGEVVVVMDKDLGYAAFKVLVTKDVFDGVDEPKGEHSRVGHTVYVPHEVSFMEHAGRIMNLSE